jgi:Flp pilus assembly protein TadB
MEMDFLGGFLAIASVVVLACILVALAFMNIAGFAMGVGTVWFLFALAYRTDRKARRKP